MLATVLALRLLGAAAARHLVPPDRADVALSRLVEQRFADGRFVLLPARECVDRDTEDARDLRLKEAVAGDAQDTGRGAACRAAR